MIPSSQTIITLAKRPGLAPIVPGETFKVSQVPVPSPSSEEAKGKVLVEVHYLSLDPAMRGWLNDNRSYVPPVKLGAIMRAYGLGTVLHSNAPGFSKGDLVMGGLGWQECGWMSPQFIEKLPAPTKGVQPTDWLGVLGGSGQTAYWGLMDIAQIKKGETVVVTGAAGSVGIVACQIAKKVFDCKVIAVAGSADKCAWLENDIGVDVALNYKDKDFAKQFREKVGYLNVMFDNVGGEILNLALSRLQPFARVVLCGAISDYNKKPIGPSNYLALIGQRAKMQGFIVMDYDDRKPQAIGDLSQWISEGKIKSKETRLKGLENAVEGLMGLFEGKNTGKMVLEVKAAHSKL
ncbi:alcohol dehydrogenase [Atractiella rhizophila]|nr:alcohol dehydrogenase [Atractiella rhizophila]